MNHAPPDLSIVIVNWNVRELLRRCLVSIAGSDGLIVMGLDTLRYSTGGGWRAEVIVVDNGSADGSGSMLAQDFPWAQVIANRENLGFTHANNQGLAAGRGRYVLFLNPDTELAPAALGLLLGYAEAHLQVGVVGPQLRYGDGSLQSSRRRLMLGNCFFT